MNLYHFVFVLAVASSNEKSSFLFCLIHIEQFQTILSEKYIIFFKRDTFPIQTGKYKNLMK